jgi:hypothetical protein
LCSAWKCAPGEMEFEGVCIPCNEGSYQPLIDHTTWCIPCGSCPPHHYRYGCGIGNPGDCLACSACADGLEISENCMEGKDTVCVNATECAGTAELLNCADGMYHAGCDKSVNEDGWCEPCPIQSAMDCPEGFFLNFKCTNTSTLSAIPNECIPCNRFTCKTHGRFPTKLECGVPTMETTMSADTISCSQTCQKPYGDEWTERLCQYFVPKTDVWTI